jgi:hypothetical protein
MPVIMIKIVINVHEVAKLVVVVELHVIRPMQVLHVMIVIVSSSTGHALPDIKRVSCVKNFSNAPNVIG